jgi:hypothetical protein
MCSQFGARKFPKSRKRRRSDRINLSSKPVVTGIGGTIPKGTQCPDEPYIGPVAQPRENLPIFPKSATIGKMGIFFRENQGLCNKSIIVVVLS